MKYALALTLNLFFGFYLCVIKPAQTFVKACQMKRELDRARNAGAL